MRSHRHALVKVDVATRRVSGKIAVGVGPVQVYVTPDNRYVLVANQGTKARPSTTLSIVDTASFAVVGTVETGRGAHGVVVDPSSRHAYVTNIYGNNVAVVDLAERKVIATIPSGAEPNGVSFSPLAPAPVRGGKVKIELPHSDDRSTVGGH